MQIYLLKGILKRILFLVNFKKLWWSGYSCIAYGYFGYQGRNYQHLAFLYVKKRSSWSTFWREQLNIKQILFLYFFFKWGKVFDSVTPLRHSDIK